MAIRKTITASDANAARIVAALDRKMERLPGETATQLFERDLREYYKDLVLGLEREQAAGAIVPDDTLIDVENEP